MHKIIGLSCAFLAASSLFVGCTTESESSGYANEIRIDAFSHYWATARAGGVVIDPTTVVRFEIQSETQFIADTLRLLDPTFDKTASLPAHTTGRLVAGGDTGAIRLFYGADYEPKGFDCFISSTGNFGVYSEVPDQGGEFLSSSYQLFVDSLPVEFGEYWIRSLPISKSVSKLFDCSYAPGKGFFLGYQGYDPYAANPERAGSEIIIRY